MTEIGIYDDRRDLEIQSKRTVVNISGAYRGDVVVYQQYLLVQESALVTIKLDPCRRYLIEKRIRGIAYEFAVGFFRNEYANVNPAQSIVPGEPERIH